MFCIETIGLTLNVPNKNKVNATFLHMIYNTNNVVFLRGVSKYDVSLFSCNERSVSTSLCGFGSHNTSTILSIYIFPMIRELVLKPQVCFDIRKPFDL